MIDRTPVTTAAELAEMDPDEIVEGYRDAWNGDAEPGDNRSKAYWHGWRNGHNDRANTADKAQRELIRDIRRTSVVARMNAAFASRRAAKEVKDA